MLRNCKIKFKKNNNKIVNPLINKIVNHETILTETSLLAKEYNRCPWSWKHLSIFMMLFLQLQYVYLAKGTKDIPSREARHGHPKNPNLARFFLKVCQYFIYFIIIFFVV